MIEILLGIGAVAAFIFIKSPAQMVIEEGVTILKDEYKTTLDSFYAHDDLFMSVGAYYYVPWWRLKAICMNESSLGEAPSVKRGLLYPEDVEGSKSTDGKSWGPMQITLPTGRDFDPNCSPQLLNNWQYSVDLAAQFIAKLQTQFPEEEFVVKSYNQGAGNSRKEKSGTIQGYADEYWTRYQRNVAKIRDKQGLM